MYLSRLFLLHVFGGMCILGFFGPTSDASNFFLGRRIPKETPDPINIDSKEVQNVNVSRPFLLLANFHDAVKVVNNGKLVEIILDRPATASKVIGGVLEGNKYVFKKIKYYWTDNTTGVAATTIDKKGYPLENIAIFYNTKYGTFENALNYRDGLAEVDFFIDICPISPNEEFNQYYKVLQNIKEAGSTEQTTLGIAIKWFAANGILIPTSAYYAYPGSYLDEATGERYYCTTVIILPHLPEWCLSKNQYDETFGSFKNPSGKPLTNTEMQFPRKMPVVQAKGIMNFNIP